MCRYHLAVRKGLAGRGKLSGDGHGTSLRHKRTSRERVGNIRFGFRLSPDGKHVEPDPGGQSVLTEIRHLRHSGHTLRGIAAALNRQALHTWLGLAAGTRSARRVATTWARFNPVYHPRLIILNHFGESRIGVLW
jgi:hypothetical protein